MSHDLCDWGKPISLGYYKDIELYPSSCCDEPASISGETPNFCVECGNRSVLYMHGRTGKPRNTVKAKALLVWSDEEDGDLWKCSSCNGEFYTCWHTPKWCAVCGASFMDSDKAQ